MTQIEIKHHLQILIHLLSAIYKNKYVNMAVVRDFAIFDRNC